MCGARTAHFRNGHDTQIRKMCAPPKMVHKICFCVFRNDPLLASLRDPQGLATSNNHNAPESLFVAVFPAGDEMKFYLMAVKFCSWLSWASAVFHAKIHLRREHPDVYVAARLALSRARGVHGDSAPLQFSSVYSFCFILHSMMSVAACGNCIPYASWIQGLAHVSKELR